MSKTKLLAPALTGALFVVAATALLAQEPKISGPSRAESREELTLKRAVALALQNSRELALARLRQTVAEKTVAVDRSAFRPNLYTGSGAAYTHGFPGTPGGGTPSIITVAYEQTLLNSSLRGQLRASQERAEIQRLEIERTRDAVILRTASAYLELAKVRHSLELLRKQRESAQKIVDITRERSKAGLELPIEITRGQLFAARVEQGIVQLEGREDELEAQLRSLTGVPPDARLEVAAEKVPLGPAQPVQELVALAMANNAELKEAEYERRARAHRLRGERGGYWPSVDLVGQYQLLSTINNFDVFFRRFRRNSLNVGLQIKVPVFAAKTTAAVGLAQSEFSAAEMELRHKRSELETEVRRQAHRTRELDAAREVARLELQLAQENLRVLQARFEEGHTNLRDLEKARLEENDKWMAFLEADYQRQRAELELLRTTGQLAHIFQ